MAKSSSSPTELTASMRIVVLRGKSQYLLTERTRQLADALRAEFGEIDRFDFEGETATPADVLDELRSYGLMHEHKLVVLDDADKFLAREGHRLPMERYAAQPVTEATLLMRAEAWRPGKIDKLIAKVGAIITCDEPGHGQAVKWCIARCEKRYDCGIDRPAAELLVAQIGPELGRLDVELTKLASFVGAGESIDRDAVAEMVGLSREEQAWAIQAALASGDPHDALNKLRELLGISRQPEELVAWAISDLLRKLHAASQLLGQGMSPGAVTKRLRLWGDGQNLILNAARRLPPERIAQLLRTSLDWSMKGRRGVGEAQRTLEALTVLVADTIGSA
ncbi:MAG: DNA polymerase III subunit delta [Phycisphaerales bacterium]|nr:MAG: DNA polymerase III subunit delta [Phycisphaerales bacterium]